MSYIYSTTSGSAEVFNNETFTYKQSDEAERGLEGLVKLGILKRKDVLDNEGVLGADASVLHTEMTLDSTGKLVVATNPTKTAMGSLAKTGVAGALVTTTNYPYSINKAGSSDISASSNLVIGAGGRLVASQGRDVSLASSVVGAATGDFDNSIWTSAGKNVVVDTLADDSTARGATVTLYFINDSGVYTEETIQLHATDSSTDKTSVAKCTKLLAVKINQSVTTSTLQVKSDIGATCKAIATPTANTLYGSIATDDADSTLGHSVQITAGTAPVADSVVAVYGTDEDSNIKVELVTFDGVATTARTTEVFKDITHLFIGDDGVATNTYSVAITENTEGQKVGTSPASTVTAGTLFEVKRV